MKIGNEKQLYPTLLEIPTYLLNPAYHIHVERAKSLATWTSHHESRQNAFKIADEAHQLDERKIDTLYGNFK